MGQVVEPDVLALEVEKVAPKLLPVLAERDDSFFTKLEKRTDVEVISNRAMRLPVQMTLGAAGSQANLNGAPMGPGAGASYVFFTCSPLEFQIASQMTVRADIATDGKEKAIASAAKREVINQAKNWRSFMERLCMTPGNGVLGAIASGAGGVTLTMAAPFGSQLFMIGMPLTSYNAAQTVQRVSSGAPVVVTNVDPVAGTVTTNVVFTAQANTDVLCVGGLSGATPVSLFGVPYFLNGASSGLVLGIDRATTPQVRTPSVTASSVLTPTFPRQALVKLRRKFGLNSSTKGFWLGAPEQRAGWENNSTLIQNIDAGGGVGGKATPDLLYNWDAESKIAGKPLLESANQDPTRLDLIVTEWWGRVEVKAAQLLRIGNQTMFPAYDPTSGTPMSSFLWYMIWSGQVWCVNPGGNATIVSLIKPAGY